MSIWQLHKLCNSCSHNNVSKSHLFAIADDPENGNPSRFLPSDAEQRLSTSMWLLNIKRWLWMNVANSQPFSSTPNTPVKTSLSKVCRWKTATTSAIRSAERKNLSRASVTHQTEWDRRPATFCRNYQNNTKDTHLLDNRTAFAFSTILDHRTSGTKRKAPAVPDIFIAHLAEFFSEQRGTSTLEKWSQRLVRLSNQRLRQRRDRVTSPGALCTQHRGRERRATVSNACRHTTNRSLV